MNQDYHFYINLIIFDISKVKLIYLPIGNNYNYINTSNILNYVFIITRL